MLRLPLQTAVCPHFDAKQVNLLVNHCQVIFVTHVICTIPLTILTLRISRMCRGLRNRYLKGRQPHPSIGFAPPRAEAA